MAGKIVAGITVSMDGFFIGPQDGPGCGLGVDGERLHYWVFGGPWRYDAPNRGEPTGHWGGTNPWDVVAPVVMGAGKRLFDGFVDSVDLEHLGVRQSPYATFIDYRVIK